MKSLTDEITDKKSEVIKSFNPQLQFSAITLFPEMFSAVTEYGVVGRAAKSGLITVKCINPRSFTNDKHRTVDDRPYGGGPGMLMKIEPLEKAIIAAREQPLNKKDKTKVVYLSPQGKKLDQQLVKELSQEEHLILLSGRYEGIDQRLIEAQVDMEISVGDFVLSGGELAAMTVIDTVTRQLPNALGHNDSAEQDSFEDGLLDHPHYTRPEKYNGLEVPAILLGGDHQAIARWRLQQRLGNTWLKRPDLLLKLDLSKSEEKLLEDFKRDHNA
ncbi:MAG: tRNA (guanosine(37)-N1)-methyltransferase TrmD [Kangiellaceae bacterium]|nr:tRNA (guanosine(37)-N1)-methyltransferase TrmD [Kangiellaceae bacterium]